MNRRLAAEQSARISSQRENKGNQLPSVPRGEGAFELCTTRRQTGEHQTIARPKENAKGKAGNGLVGRPDR